jgi:hypothetical protein
MEGAPTIPIDTPPAPPTPRWRTYTLRTIIWLLLGALFFFAFKEGVRLRYWAFQISDPMRFAYDLKRGTFWGLVASGPEGYLNQYDKMANQVPEWQDFRWVPWLDYGPLRLLVMREWGVWQRKHHPPDPNVSYLDAWKRSYSFNEPVLRFNMALEAFSAICAFLLTRLWVIRGLGDRKPRHFEGVWQGAVAALLLWFSADVIVSAHMWFQWDSWVIPFYLCTCLLASLDWWFAAGLAFAIGVAMKGQMLSISPIFVIWPLIQGKPGAALRGVCGAFFGTAVIATGWLVSYIPKDNLNGPHLLQVFTNVENYPARLYAFQRTVDYPAITWIAGMLLAAGAIPWLLRWLAPDSIPSGSPTSFRDRVMQILRSQWTWIACGALLIFFSAYWPCFLSQNRQYWLYGVVASAALAATALLIRPRNQAYLLAAVIAVGLLSCICLFHGSTAWWDCGIHYGSIHWPYLKTGPVNNIPALFEERWGWPREVSTIAFTLPAISGHWPAFITKTLWGYPAASLDVTEKMLFFSIYLVALLLSGIAIGLQARRGDRRMLVALTTPWIMFFLFPAQIQERYLLYASGAAVCCIGDSVGMALLGLMLTFCSTLMHFACMMMFDQADIDGFGRLLTKEFPSICTPTAGQTFKHYIDNTHPDMAWGVLVIGLIFLYQSFMPTKRRPTAKRTPSRLIAYFRSIKNRLMSTKPKEIALPTHEPTSGEPTIQESPAPEPLAPVPAALQ